MDVRVGLWRKLSAEVSTPEPMLCNKESHHSEKPATRQSPCSNTDWVQPKLKQNKNLVSNQLQVCVDTKPPWGFWSRDSTSRQGCPTTERKGLSEDPAAEPSWTERLGEGRQKGEPACKPNTDKHSGFADSWLRTTAPHGPSPASCTSKSQSLLAMNMSLPETEDPDRRWRAVGMADFRQEINTNTGNISLGLPRNLD